MYETNTRNCTICRTVTGWVDHSACIFAEPAKTLHRPEYKDDTPDDMYGMHVPLHGVSQVLFVKVYRFPCINHGRS